jgi:hypothetical protein
MTDKFKEWAPRAVQKGAPIDQQAVDQLVAEVGFDPVSPLSVEILEETRVRFLFGRGLRAGAPTPLVEAERFEGISRAIETLWKQLALSPPYFPEEIPPALRGPLDALAETIRAWYMRSRW